jgi:hypothetical protein
MADHAQDRPTAKIVVPVSRQGQISSLKDFKSLVQDYDVKNCAIATDSREFIRFRAVVREAIALYIANGDFKWSHLTARQIHNMTVYVENRCTWVKQFDGSWIVELALKLTLRYRQNNGLRKTVGRSSNKHSCK